MSVKLTVHEAEGLDYAVHATDCTFTDVVEQVERIVAARVAAVEARVVRLSGHVADARIDRDKARDRLAAVEALADEWERQASDPTDPAYKIGLFSAAGELRAAVRAVSSEAPA